MASWSWSSWTAAPWCSGAGKGWMTSYSGRPPRASTRPGDGAARRSWTCTRRPCRRAPGRRRHRIACGSRTSGSSPSHTSRREATFMVRAAALRGSGWRAGEQADSAAPGRGILGLAPGGVAQLVERYVRNVEVGGSSPLTSTIIPLVRGPSAGRPACRPRFRARSVRDLGRDCVDLGSQNPYQGPERSPGCCAAR